MLYTYKIYWNNIKYAYNLHALVLVFGASVYWVICTEKVLCSYSNTCAEPPYSNS